jgi:hypothetical protein
MFNFFAHLEVPVPSYLVELLSIDNKAALENILAPSRSPGAILPF